MLEDEAKLLAKWIVAEHHQSRRNVEVIRRAWFCSDEEWEQQVKPQVEKLMEVK